MKIDNYDIESIIPYKTSSSYSEEEGSVSFIERILAKKVRNKKMSFYEERILAIGRDALYEELSGASDAYWVQNTPSDLLVILTKNYLIIPHKEIFPLQNIKKFAIYNLPEGHTPFEQYAEDRIDEPYDPLFVSEFEGEESFELDRFNIRLIIIDNTELRYEYIFPMETADRKDFRDALACRCNAEDHSSEDVLEGRFYGLRADKDIL